MNSIDQIINSIKIQDILIFILIITVIYILFRISAPNENFESNDSQILIPKNTIDSINNLGLISKSIMTGTNLYTESSTGNPGDLTIPANSIISGNLNVNGKLTLNNVDRIILVNNISAKYNGGNPFLDSNGFTIPSDKYYYRTSGGMVLPVIDEITRDWWGFVQEGGGAPNQLEVIEFIPRSYYNSNSKFNDYVVNFDRSKTPIRSKVNTTDINPYKNKIDTNPYP